MTNAHDNVVPESGAGNELKRRLESRHVQLISISGAIGTGLFMGSGKVIALSGTSIILVYAIIGFFVFCVMRAMGEMLLSDLRFKSFADVVATYLGAEVGFVLAWSYWLAWCVAAIADMVMVAGFFQYWYPDAPTWAPAMFTLVVLVGLNLLAVKVFGEVEFWFGLIKVVAIVLLIIAGFVLISMAYTSPNGVTASMSHLVERGSMLPHGISGFFAGFQIAIFSFAGTELIGTTAAEARNPEQTLKKAINTIPVRIMLFYVLSLMCIISVVSWGLIPANKSPFVELFLLAGFPAAAGMINFVVITSAASSANSGIYSGARVLFGLSKKMNAPAPFGQTSRQGAPANAIIFTGVSMLAGVALLLFIPEVMTIFTLVSTVSAIIVLFTWSMITISYMVYRKRSPELHVKSAFKFRGGIPLALITQLFLIGVLGLLSLEADTRAALYAMPFWFLFLVVAYRWKLKTRAPMAVPVSLVRKT